MTLRLPASTPRATRSPAAQVVGEDRAGQAVLGVVGQGRSTCVLVVERHHRDDRTEDLLAPDPRLGVLGGDHAGRYPEAVAAGRRAGERDLDLVEVAADRRLLLRRDQRPHLAGLVGRIEHPQAGDRGLELRQELVVRRALDEDPGAGAAVLAGVVEDGVRRAGGRGVDVCVGEDDVGALAAELEGEPLHLVGAAGHDLLADGRRAGEADLAHQRVGHEPLADHAAVAGDDRQDVARGDRPRARAHRGGSPSAESAPRA